ncbi:MAG: iron-containing alcohol dehydrogenase [Pseudomonadota bacterium]|nr:iron-containing alcohol dehydrogenase [Pseudomonadota bacterium]MEC8698575.1 iron-containing alcohol dehydrogenase [Pseudomonadota bacterium]
MWRMRVKALNGDGVNDTEGITGMERTAFKASGYAWRLYTGPQAIERGLVESVDRARAKRVFVVCSPSVNNRTDIVRRIEAELGERYAGVFYGIEKDSTYRSVVAAKEAAEEAGADLLIGAGGGSVLVATRVVAVYMGEDADPFEIMTQYPEGKPAYSPRLMAPKPPIFNIPTTPTSAMNRGGSGLKNPDLDHRMEYFDPKTRPQSIFIDDDALLSAPKDLIRSTATTVFASLVGAMSQTDLNALAQGDQQTAYGLAYPAYMRLMDELDNPQLRVDLAMAAFLQNRAEDDGRRRFTTNAFAGNYAVSTALHLRYPNVGQGESTSVVHASSMRLAETPDIKPARAVAKALEVWEDGMDAGNAVAVSADKLEAVYSRIGVPTALSQLDISRDDLINIAKETIKNFNANAGARSPDEQVASAMKLLEAAW